ncbi:hypothetical protein SORDD17_00299 [Streptococcus oralis]|uniref:Uncharacterized protein n=1 Tax=Streptococcus oralis TaxID=1303 RepID=A0A139RP11_STROR|nr:hypothetical protein SORDD17_00299 [Streptococcus oralis]
MSVLSTTSKQCFELSAPSFLVCSLIFIEYTTILRPMARAFVYVERFGVYVVFAFSGNI